MKEDVGKGLTRTLRRMRKSDAYHEAGHVAMAWSVGLIGKVKSVDILSSEDGAVFGRMKWRRKTMIATDRQFIMIALAGPIAEAKYRKCSLVYVTFSSVIGNEGLGGDYERAMAIANEHGDPSKVYEVCKKSAKERMRSLWPAVVAVADELLAKQKITGAEAERLISMAMLLDAGW